MFQNFISFAIIRKIRKSISRGIWVGKRKLAVLWRNSFRTFGLSEPKQYNIIVNQPTAKLTTRNLRKSQNPSKFMIVTITLYIKLDQSPTLVYYQNPVEIYLAATVIACRPIPEVWQLYWRAASTISICSRILVLESLICRRIYVPLKSYVVSYFGTRTFEENVLEDSV